MWAAFNMHKQFLTQAAQARASLTKRLQVGRDQVWGLQLGVHLAGCVSSDVPWGIGGWAWLISMTNVRYVNVIGCGLLRKLPTTTGNVWTGRRAGSAVRVRTAGTHVQVLGLLAKTNIWSFNFMCALGGGQALIDIRGREMTSCHAFK